VAAALVLLVPRVPAQAEQFFLFDELAAYPAHNHGAGAAFHGWLANPSVPTNWVAPVNYRDGTAYVRYEVLRKQEPGSWKTLATMWSKRNHGEIHRFFTWANDLQVGNVYNGQVAIQDQTIDGGPVEWNWEDAVDEGYIVCAYAGSPPKYRHLWDEAADQSLPLYDEMLPITNRVTVIIVSHGGTFAAPQGWTEYNAMAPILGITTPGIGPGEVGVPYSATIEATGGASPYEWSVSAGELPPGLVLNADGSVTGTPAEVGRFIFVAKVADSQTPPFTFGKRYLVTIAATTGVESPFLSPAEKVRWSVTPSVCRAGATVRYSVSRGMRVRIDITDHCGARVRTLADRPCAAGPHEVFWDGTDRCGRRAACGTYFCHVRTPGHASAGKIVLVE
jgi:hypothetical protein